MKIHHLEPNQVPEILKREYKGRKFKAIITDKVEIPITAGLWDGGHRDDYWLVRLSDGWTKDLNPPGGPFNTSRSRQEVTLHPGIVVVKQASHGGLTFYVRADDVAPMLSDQTIILTRAEKLVLYGSARYKARYNGKHRYDMVGEDLYWAKREHITEKEWDEAVESLIKKKLLSANKAIRPAGRNAAPDNIREI